MERIDFDKMKKELHIKIYEEIKKLMKYYNKKEIDFTEDELKSAFVVRSVSGYESTEEVIVTKVRINEDDYLEYQTGEYNEENEWLSLGIYGDVLWCTISSLYDTIYDKLVKEQNQK